MATFAAERTFAAAVAAAEMTRQNAISAAFTAYGFNQAGYATYIAAIATAQAAYATSIVSAATTAALDPELGMHGPIPVGPVKLSGN